MTDTNHSRRLLEQQLAELQERLAHLDRDLSETPDADSGERAVQAEDDEALEGQAALVSAEIASVTRALDRIADGTYGACTACGEQIAPGRLEARPEASLCITCASAQT
ncbi:MAG: TraR/DksA family transcriptional regulator [Croceibacterium sp.]